MSKPSAEYALGEVSGEVLLMRADISQFLREALARKATQQKALSYWRIWIMVAMGDSEMFHSFLTVGVAA